MITRRIFVVAAACAISMISACDQDSALAPTGVVPPQLPRLSIGPPTASATLGVTSITDPSISAELVTYPDPVFVEVRLTGAITQTVINGGYYSAYSGPVYGPGIWVDGVHQACYVNLTVYHGYGPTGFGTCYRTPLPDTLHVDTALFKGVVTVRRGGAIPISDAERSRGCGEACYAYSGSQTLTITRIPAELTLTGPPAVSPGTPITTTGSVAPQWIKGMKIPFIVQRWRWVPNSGPAVVNPAGCTPPAEDTNPANCTFTPANSGVLEIEALVNGVAVTRKRNISVVANPRICSSAVMKVWGSISSRFGDSEAFRKRPHAGRDYAVPSGTAIYAAESGTVVDRGRGRSSGIRVVVKGTMNSYYYHLSSIAPGLSEGDNVSAGTLLGYSGATGEGITGPHLHFQQHTAGPVWVNGLPPRSTVVDPCYF